MQGWESEVRKQLAAEGPAISRWTAIRDVLTQRRLCYTQVLTPGQVCTHPANRSGLGLNGHQVHRVGGNVQRIGASRAELRQATCVELPACPDRKHKALGFNEKMIQMNNGRLAVLSGQERYMSLSCSHFVAFCRAVQGACESEIPELSTNGHLSSGRLSESFRDIVDNGWEWLVLHREVDEKVPELASFVQLTLNAAQGVAHAPSELEIMMHLVERVGALQQGAGSAQWETIVAEAASVLPEAPTVTMSACAQFCRFFAGGSNAPVVRFLHEFALKYGATKRLGEEFINAVATVRLSSNLSGHALGRAALLAANLVSPKVVDGVARLVSKTDVNRLAGKHLGRIQIYALQEV